MCYVLSAPQIAQSNMIRFAINGRWSRPSAYFRADASACAQSTSIWPTLLHMISIKFRKWTKVLMFLVRTFLHNRNNSQPSEVNHPKHFWQSVCFNKPLFVVCSQCDTFCFHFVVTFRILNHSELPWMWRIISITKKIGRALGIMTLETNDLTSKQIKL